MKYLNDPTRQTDKHISIQTEEQGLKRRIVSTKDNTVLCECNGTKIDIIKCIATSQSYGLACESPIIFENLQEPLSNEVNNCLECAKNGLMNLQSKR